MHSWQAGPVLYRIYIIHGVSQVWISVSYIWWRRLLTTHFCSRGCGGGSSKAAALSNVGRIYPQYGNYAGNLGGFISSWSLCGLHSPAWKFSFCHIIMQLFLKGTVAWDVICSFAPVLKMTKDLKSFCFFRKFAHSPNTPNDIKIRRKN
jgi:hypothetical protein